MPSKVSFILFFALALTGCSFVKPSAPPGPPPGSSPVPSFQEPQQANGSLKVNITILQAKNCQACNDAIGGLGYSLQHTGVEILDSKILESTSQEAQKLIAENQITQLPAVLMSSPDTALLRQYIMQRNGRNISWRFVKDVAILESSVVYEDVGTGKTHGKLDIIALEDPSCSVCSTASALVTRFAQDLKLSTTKTLDYRTSEGERLIKQYHIEKIPTLILFGELSLYKGKMEMESFEIYGSRENDGAIVLRDIPAPYRDLATQKIVGLVKMTMVSDKSCKTCYDPAPLKDYVEFQFGMKVQEVSNVDVSSAEGKKLVNQYALRIIPTILLSPEAATYTSRSALWENVWGSVEGDGFEVMRGFDRLDLPLCESRDIPYGKCIQTNFYKDLQSGKLFHIDEGPICGIIPKCVRVSASANVCSTQESEKDCSQKNGCQWRVCEQQGYGCARHDTEAACTAVKPSEHGVSCVWDKNTQYCSPVDCFHYAKQKDCEVAFDPTTNLACLWSRDQCAPRVDCGFEYHSKTQCNADSFCTWNQEYQLCQNM